MNLKKVISEVLYGLDWVTPLAAEVQDWTRGPVTHLSVSGVDRTWVAARLRKAGVDYWGLMYAPTDGRVMVTVKEKDRARAEWALRG